MNIVLNKNQEIASLHNTGPMMVIAGPGSGKTTVITHRIKNLIERFDIQAKDILVISFTKASAQEMKNRFLKLNNGYKNYQEVTFGTFHSYFFRIIRAFYKYNLNNILNDNEKHNIIKKILNELKINFDNEEDFLQNIINEISIIKNELINPLVFDSCVVNSTDFQKIYSQYENIKKSINKIDFDDMLINCYNLLKENENIKNFWKEKYKYILIDEFQDSATRF